MFLLAFISFILAFVSHLMYLLKHYCVIKQHNPIGVVGMRSLITSGQCRTPGTSVGLLAVVKQNQTNYISKRIYYDGDKTMMKLET